MFRNKSEPRVRIIKKINIAHYQSEKKPRGSRERSFPPLNIFFLQKGILIEIDYDDVAIYFF